MILHADNRLYVKRREKKHTNKNAKEYTVQSVARAVEILQCFENRPEIGLTELSHMVGLHKSTTAGIVSTLQAKKFLEKNDKSDKYRLGLEFFRLGASSQSDLRSVCRPYLSELLYSFGETVNLAVLDGTDIVYIEKMEGNHSMRICTRIGQRIPFHCTANGKCIAAFISEEARRRVLDSASFSKFTGKTITDKDVLSSELEQIRTDGFARDNEEFEDGLICIAAPILGSNGLAFGAISLSGPTLRLNAEKQEEIIRRLKSAASNISNELMATNSGRSCP